MKRQEIFDKVWDHFVTNNGRFSYRRKNGTKFCAYRGQQGARCVIGLFIPDEDYNEDMEGLSIDKLVYLFPKLRSALPHVQTSNDLFFYDLQQCHDMLFDRHPKSRKDAIKSNLIYLAKKYKLKVPKTGE